MPTEIKIPAVGESITEVQIGDWLKSEGDVVKRDEPLAMLDSEKTTLELTAPHDGRLVKILRKAGETVSVGEVIAHLEPVSAKSEEKSAPSSPPAKPQKPQPKTPAKEPAPETKSAPEPPAEKAPPEPPKPEPSPKPQIIDEKPTPPPAASASGRAEDVVPMTMLRRTVARRLVEAQQTMAMLTTFNETDLSVVQALRKEFQPQFEKRYGIKLGLMSFFVKAAIDALKQFPQLNAEIRGNDIVYRDYYDIGVAVSTERGLVVPVLRNAEGLSFAEVEKCIGDFAKRAKENQLKPEDLEGGTFTITNGGVFGSLLSTPIINPPQTGILGLHAVQDRPVAVQGQVVIRPMMYLALTYDHRLVDGREAVLFLRRIKEALETPTRMLVEI